MPIKAYIIPILHTEICIGNQLLKSFLDWVDLRIKRVPDDEIYARYLVYEANTELRTQSYGYRTSVGMSG